MKAREYVTLQVERTRGQLRATAFLRMGNNSLELRGKTLHEFVTDLLLIKKKPIELVDAIGTSNLCDAGLPGDIVSIENVFTTNEGMIWDGTNIRFRTASGAVVSPEQYEYLKTQCLGPAQIFAESEQSTQDVKSVWKSMSRMAREARNDKAKEIFYITFGELIWEISQGKKEAKKVKSPLFIMQVKEETTPLGVYKFKISRPILKQNSVLRREVLKQTGVNIYDGCADDVSLQDIEKILAQVSTTVLDYLGNMRVELDSYHLCILDSHDESVCQAVEKNIDSISESMLTKLLSGELSVQEDIASHNSECAMILPLPADESQKRVVAAVLNGQSVYSPAPAGAGKSQTSVNIAANLAIQGKSVCVMSEKLAANEVFLDYAARIGLDKYCLSVNSDMRTADIVRQIKSIAKISRQYVHTTQAKETVKRYSEAVEEYECLSGELYRTDPVLKSSLYELISVSVSAPEMVSVNFDNVKKSGYSSIKNALLNINSSCFEIMTDSEFKDYFYNSSCADMELRKMIEKALSPFYENGIDLSEVIRNNNLNRNNTTKCVLANVARKLAIDIIGEKNLYEVGNRKVKSVYKRLADTHLQMQELYISYLHQELSARIVDNIDDRFISSLDKLKVTKITPQELFGVYGKDILAICPIIITTPTAATNYIYETGLDDFYAMIVDEASQMQIISILSYTDRTKQLIVFGDSMQLGITSTFMKKDFINAEEAVKDTAYSDRSVLQAAQGRLPSYGLKYHYRSGTEMLIHISNKTCYDGLLEIVPDIYTERNALPKHLGLEIIQVAPPESSKKGENESEALEIATRVESLRDEYPGKSIGIIAFNEKQQELISDLLEEALNGYADSDQLWVRSLENAQGKEADFVFISIGHYRRNQDGSLHKGISEINRAGGENRLNVLFTRARCKNYIVMSFDYRELKKSDNEGIKRLYEYIDYAANGEINESSVSRLGNIDHAVVHRMAEMLETIAPLYKTKTRIGSENMAVDIAVKENGNFRYSLGILMPSFGQTPQETMTKIFVLERAGWHLSPVSPIYFLVSEDVFKAQVERDIKEPISFTSTEHMCFDTNREPDVIFTAKDLIIRSVSEKIGEITPITEDDFLAMNFKTYYEGSLCEEFWSKDVKELNALAKDGNTEANLVLLIVLRERFISEGKRRVLLANVSRLYSVYNERRASFLFAQLLRITDAGNNTNLIKNLLREAYELGIGGE